MPLDEIPPLFWTSEVPTLRARVTETISTLREVVLMPRDIGPVVPSDVRAGCDVAVLIHGFFASAGVFRPMKRHLVDDAKVKVASFTYAPGPGIARIAKSLARIVEKMPR